MAKSYWIKQKAETPAQHTAQFGNDRVSAVVKDCLIKYVSSFLDSDGRNRGFIASAFPSMELYVSNAEQVDLSKDDTSKRELQLAGLYERMKHKLPCILFDDESVEYVNSGLGNHYSSNFLDGDRTQLWFKVVRDVTVKVVIGATDLTTCSGIRDSVSVMFGDICRFTNGNVLTEESDEISRYTVTLYNNKFQLGNAERVNTGTGDSADSFVAFTQGSITCRFEGSFAMEMPTTTHVVSRSESEVELSCPNEMLVGTSAVLKVKHCPPNGMRVMSTDSNVVALQPLRNSNRRDEFRLLAMRSGEASIQLVDTRFPSPRSTVTTKNVKIVKEIQIKVKQQ